MSTRWESLAGDTSRFAIKMSFLDDRSSLEVDREMSSSWGALEIWLDGVNLCAHVEEGESVQGVHWYLLPLLEWLAANWNPMLHEERLPVRNADRDAASSLYRTRFSPDGLSEAASLQNEEEWFAWRQRHALHAARDGGLFPEIFVRRWEDQIEVSWSDRVPAGVPDGFRFLVPYGSVRLETEDVAQPLYSVLRAAVRQLKEWNPDSVRLTELSDSVAGLNKPKRQRSARLDWLFSLSIQGSVDAEPWPAVEQLFKDTSTKIKRAVLEPAGSGLALPGSSHAVLLFGSVDPDVALDDARLLAELLVDLFKKTGGDSVSLLALVDELATVAPEGLPWEQGYELAERTLEMLNLDDDGAVDVVGILGSLDVRVADIRLSDHRVRGVGIAGPQHQPAAYANQAHPRNQSEQGRRFTLAHEFCHLLVDRRAGLKLAVASGPWAPIELEQRANAFAAYLLMPPERVRAHVGALPVSIDTADGVLAIAEAFQTSPRATLEHLHNLGWIDEFTRDGLRGTGLSDGSFGRPEVESGG